MAFVNNYKIMDVFNAIDQHTGAMIIPARIYVDSSFKGADPDYGQSMQRVINTDKVSYVYHTPDPRMEWPATPGYGLHDNADEFGYIIRGEYEIVFPDGSVEKLSPGSFYQIKKGQPYRFVGTDDNAHLAYGVFYNKKVQDVTKVPYKEGEAYEGGKCVKKAADLSAVEGTPKGVEMKLLAEDDNLVIYDMVIKPNTSYPNSGFLCSNCYQTTVVLSGNGMGVYPDKDYKFVEETVAYNEPGQPIKILNTGDEDLHVLVAYNTKDAASIENKTYEISDFV